MVSLCVFKVVEGSFSEIINSHKIFPPQRNLNDFPGSEFLDSPKSKIKEIVNEDGFLKLSIKHYTDTINRPIRVFWENLQSSQDTLKGFQEIYDFDLWYKEDTKELFFFTKSPISKQFINRVKGVGEKIEIDEINFDLSKVANTPLLTNVWGIWVKTGEAKTKSRAAFGYNIHENEEELMSKNITTLDVEITSDEGAKSLVISKYGRISTNSNISRMELLKIYEELKRILIN